jgi:HK97 family phage portal protein
MLTRLRSLFRWSDVPPAVAESRSTPSLENPQTSLANPAAWLAIALGGHPSDTGISVTAESAVRFAPLWQGINLIAGDVAKLPLHVYKRMSDGGRERDVAHAADWLIDGKPNDEQTCGIFRRTLTAHAILHGDGFAYIIRSGSAKPTELVLLNPRATELVRDRAGQLWYLTTVAGEKRKLDPTDVLHIRGLGFDGYKGLGLVEVARQVVGLGLAMEKFGATFFRNGARSSGVLTTPGKLSPKAASNLQETFQLAQAGLENVGKTILLEEGAKYIPLTISQNEAQFIESSKFNRQVIASFLGLPPHKLGDNDRTSYSSLEVSQQEYLDGCLSNWLMAWTDECFDKLLTEQEKRQRTHYFEFNTAALLAADIKSRSEVYASAVSNGWMSRNEVRRRENLPSAGADGDRLTIQSNMQYLDQVGQAPPQQSAQEQNTKLLDSLKAVMRDTGSRMVRRLAGSVRRVAKKPDFVAQLDSVFDPYRPVFRAAFAPAVEALNSAGAKLSLEELVDGHVAAARSSLAGMTDVDEWAERFEQDEIERLLTL